MIIPGTMLTVADNSKAKKAICIGIPGFSHKRRAKVGDRIKVSIRESEFGKFRKGKDSVFSALVIRTVEPILRKTGGSMCLVSFSDNAVILLSPTGKANKFVPYASSISGVVAEEAARFLSNFGLSPVVA